MIIQFFYEVFYRPLFNALFLLYEQVTFADLGFAIILLTVLIRFLLYPLFHRSARNQMVMQKLQPRIQRIQKDHKTDKEGQVRALMALYREHDVNPFSGFLLLLVQLPILVSLYHVFLSEFIPESFAALYSFVSVSEPISVSFLGLINLKNRSIIIVILAAFAQFIQGKMAFSRRPGGGEETSMERMGRQMILLMPAITLLVLWNLPSAVGLYWLTSSLFSIGQQIHVNKSLAQFHEHDTINSTNTKRGANSDRNSRDGSQENA